MFMLYERFKPGMGRKAEKETEKMNVRRLRVYLKRRIRQHPFDSQISIDRTVIYRLIDLLEEIEVLQKI